MELTTGQRAGALVLLLAVLAGTALTVWRRGHPAAAPPAAGPPAAGAPAAGAVRAGGAAEAVRAGEESAPAPDAPAGRELVVHVAGAVARPGVYRLPPGARVVDAVAAAGGPAAGSRADLVNLAAPVADGQRVYIPSREDVRALGTGVTAWPEEGGAAGPAAGGPRVLDLNRAGPAELETLPGIGPSLARRIVEHRQAHGPFRRLEDLLQVPGIGPAKLQQVRPYLTVR